MMFSFILIKEPCPSWLSFFLHCWQSTYHLPLYRITHTSTDFAGWASVMQSGQESSVSPFPNLVLLSACPWQHHDTPLAPLVAHRGRGRGTECCCWGNEAHSLTLLLHTDKKGQNQQPHCTPDGVEISETFFHRDSCSVRSKFTTVAFSLPFSSQLCWLPIQALQKEDIINHETWKFESDLRDHSVHWLLNSSEELQDLPDAPRGYAATPTRRERAPGLCVTQPLQLGQLCFDLLYILKFLISFPLQKGFCA